ncbi:MAG: NAD(P)H-dependent oxidoreductase [Bacteroidales bacterium]|nr:NAD(P)H-dependent oxidoreductase [Bacteroidales bacterium]
MKIYVLLGHPTEDSLNKQIYQNYCESARNAGHEVRSQILSEMKFDPILWQGYKAIQTLEPDLLEAQQNIQWCEKWVIIYPMWWGAMPALLKGFFDRALHPGFGFKAHEKGAMWDKLLKGRQAHVITTCDAPNFWVSIVYRNADKFTIKKAILEYCGIKPVKFTRFDRIKFKSEMEIKKVLDKINSLAK